MFKLFVLSLLFVAPLFAADIKAKPEKARKTASAAQETDPVEQEYEKLLLMDDLAQKEADRWIKDEEAFAAKGAASPSKTALSLKVEKRLEPVKKAYEDFILKHPRHTEARLAYGSFLNDTGDEAGAVVQWEKAREIDPQNPAAWNNLANYYGHGGPVKKAFEYYGKAIELNTNEPVYYHNLATTTYLFRMDAKEYYNINEQQVFDRALDLYKAAMRLDPTNFLLATDYAQSFYGIKPMRTNEAVASWQHALALAPSEDAKQGVYLHLARVELNTGHFDEAREHLRLVTNEAMFATKKLLQTNLLRKEMQAAAPPASGAVKQK